MTRGKGEGNRRDGPTMHGTWPTACHQGQATAAQNKISGCASKSYYPKHRHFLTKIAHCFRT